MAMAVVMVISDAFIEGDGRDDGCYDVDGDIDGNRLIVMVMAMAMVAIRLIISGVCSTLCTR